MKQLLLLILLFTNFSVNALSIVEPYPPWECIDGYIISFDKTHCVKVGEDRNAERPLQPSTLWYENGQIEREGYNENGKSVGWWRFWLEDGQIDYVKNYSSF